MTVKRIHITGIVQGVGFRPFVYQIAQRANLTGWVANTSAGVDIVLECDDTALEAFVRTLMQEKPPLAQIDSIQVFDVPGGGERMERFEIRSSVPLAGAFQPISPDIAICPDCLRELFDANDRRYRYPFINCTNCGPRFTIIRDIPYDRPLTTMREFSMCDECAREYHDPSNRRFHAQPIACPVCGPSVWLEPSVDASEKAKPTTHQAAVSGPWSAIADPIKTARQLLARGQIVAIKGLGGFHLACDATNPNAVRLLRERKLRVDKPFALMLPDLATVAQHCFTSDLERALLESPERPIVLLERRSESNIAAAVAPGQKTLGVMLPYTPLHYLLLTDGERRKTKGPSSSVLVMTSGNLSDEPIATDNDEARERLAKLADAFLMHNRDIQTRCDDSVVRSLPRAGLTIPASSNSASTNINPLNDVHYPLRRSRGYAPFPVHLPFQAPTLLATGAELKNAFCVTRDRYAFLSHHIGDMENYETLRSFETGVAHFERLFRIQPIALAYDLHPNYLATRYALERAEREGLPAVGVQHHYAHIASCMVENGLTGDRPVIGVAFDGTGYGDDGAIWGGEFLIADYASYRRAYHLDYVRMPGGDKAVREPWRLALAWLHRIGVGWSDEWESVQMADKDMRCILRQQIQRGVNAPATSSMGRLFDAVAALAGVKQVVNYEAQAAIEFEAQVDASETAGYEFDIHDDIVDPAPVIRSVVKDLQDGAPIGTIAGRFHNGVAQMVQRVCLFARQTYGLNEVALSGGVWQNMRLLEQTITLLTNAGLTVYVHRLVPTNDGGLALGQAAVAGWKMRNGKGQR